MSRRRVPYTVADVEAARAEVEGGASRTETAEKYGIPYGSMSAVFHGIDVYPEPGHKGRGVGPYVKRPNWTRESLIERIRDWVELYGEIPSATDWNPSMARKYGQIDRVKRFESGNWPYLTTIRQHFGSWNAAMKAAGFEPRKRCNPNSHPMKRVEP